MGTTTGRKLAQRRLGGHLRPTLEHLETRQVLSASLLGSTSGLASVHSPVITVSPTANSSLSIVSTTPANSAALVSSPSTIRVTFDRALDDFLVSNNDFELVHVASDGSTSPMQPGEASLGESLDPNGRQIDLDVSKPLTAGRYRLLLNPEGQLRGLDGSTLANTSSGLVLSDFSFSPPQSGLVSAVDLQALGPRVEAVPGRLDLAANPGAVQYYKFELAPGNHWLVGLEISAHRDGGTLDSSLSLFDARGHLISTSSEGLAGDPGDPYLFQGLDPGTYYVGVAAARNIPSASGAYDPAASGVESGNPGGPFQLHVVADPANQPTKVLGLQLDRADPLSTSPTGLTLQFSGPLDVSSLGASGHHPLTLIDEAGATWTLTPLQYDPSDGQLSLVFDHPLAPGSYTLQLAGPGSLLDLAGRAPIADGLAAGTLGSFDVALPNLVPGDLGPILPGLGSSGLVSTVTVAPGLAMTEQFVVIEPGVYSFQGVAPESGVRFAVEDASGNIVATGPGISKSIGVDAYLAPGAYQLVLTTTWTQSTTASLAIIQRLNQASSLLESGVGQGPALNLRLVTPQANFGLGTNASTASTTQPVANIPTPSTGVSGSVAGHSSPTGAGRSAEGVATVTVGLGSTSGPSVVGLTLASGPVGRPSSQANPIGAVGPTGPSGPAGLASIASNSDDLPAGLIVVPASTDGEIRSDPEQAPIDPSFNPERTTPPGTGVTLEAGLLARPPGSRREDDRTLADADRIGQFLANALAWVEGTPGRAVDKEVEPSSTIEGASPAIEPAPIEESRLESASVGSPFAIGIVLGVIAFGSRRKLFGRKATLARVAPKVAPQPLLAGPHRRSRIRVH